MESITGKNFYALGGQDWEPGQSKLSDLAAGIDLAVARHASALFGWLLWPVLVSIALGSGLWFAFHPGQLARRRGR